MREFSASYLRETRRGLWDDDRSALSGLELSTRERILDVGCGTGELTRVLGEESPGTVLGIDADRSLLSVAAAHSDVVAGDATCLPVADHAVDLVVCQALLVNLPDPVAGLEEFARASSDLVAAIEPDNAAVRVDSTVEAESTLAARARRAFLSGARTNAALDADAIGEFFEDAGLSDVRTTHHEHVRTVEPPYSEPALAAAQRKASGSALADDRETMLAGDLDPAEYDRLRSRWREMGRETIEQIRAGEYRRREVVPVSVTVGRV